MAIRQAMILAFGLSIVAVPPSRGGAQEPLSTVVAGEHQLPFQARDGLIYIEAQVNGTRTKVLVDTGAMQTMFSLKVVPTLEANSRITVNMANRSVSALTIPVGLTLGNPDQRRRCSFHLNAVVGDFKFLGADGVVGLDVLGFFKSATFDFKNSVLILEDRSINPFPSQRSGVHPHNCCHRYALPLSPVISYSSSQSD